MHKSTILLLTLLWTSLNLGGCASTKESILPQEGPSMQAVYDAHIRKMNAQDPLVLRQALGHRGIHRGEKDLAGYTREAFNEIDLLFPRLPNPTLVLYVFPHLSGKTHTPVPGYATAFPMYERVEYALPGELPVRSILQSMPQSMPPKR